MTTSLVAFISSQSNPVCLLSLHWEKTTIETIFLFWEKKISLCIHVMFKMRCVMYVLCTSPMYPLSTHNHNLYTFAQSTRCLYIHSYFMSRMVVVGFFFLYMCMCQISFVPANNETIDMYHQTDWMCVFPSARACARARYVMWIFSLLFIVRENKSPWRKWIECVLPQRCCELAVYVRCAVLIRSYYLVLVVRVWSLFTSGSNVRTRWGPPET